MKEESPIKTLALLNAYRIIFTSSPDGLPLEGISANELAETIEHYYRSGKISEEKLLDGVISAFFEEKLLDGLISAYSEGEEQCQE